MKKLLVPLLALVLVAGISIPTADAAWGGGWHGRWGRGERHEFHRGHGCVACGFLGGLVLGGIVGGALAAPYYAPPATVYAPPPPPACYTQPGYWSQVPHTDPYGYITYQNVWVPPQTVCE